MRRGERGGDWIEVSVYRHLPTSPGYWRSITEWMTAQGLRQGLDYEYDCREDWTFVHGHQTLTGQQIDFRFHPSKRSLAALFKLTWGGLTPPHHSGRG